MVSSVATDHNHNGLYERTESCDLKHKAVEAALQTSRDVAEAKIHSQAQSFGLQFAALRQSLNANKKLTWTVLVFQFGTLGTILIKWAIG